MIAKTKLENILLMLEWKEVVVAYILFVLPVAHVVIPRSNRSQFFPQEIGA